MDKKYFLCVLENYCEIIGSFCCEEEGQEVTVPEKWIM